MSFNSQGELLAILTPLVGHVLDGVYASKSVQFDAPAPFTDAEAIKVINGVVKTGDIPKGTKPNQFTSAADNYGYALGIMKKDGTKQLNTKGNEFVQDLDEWIETQTSQGNRQISVETVCAMRPKERTPPMAKKPATEPFFNISPPEFSRPMQSCDLVWLGFTG